MFLIPNTYWQVKETRNKGRGVFAKKEIKAGVIIGDYIGKILHPQDALVDEENFYLMYYHDHAVISPNLEKPGVHLLNHSCIPNAFLYTYKGHTLAFALKRILKGEELTIPYLLSPIDKFCDPCPHVCHCGNLKCTKTMHLSEEKYKNWRKLNKKWAEKTKRERISFGKELPLLSLYPKSISKDYIRGIKVLLV